MTRIIDFQGITLDLLSLPGMTLAKLGGHVNLSPQAIMRLRDGEVTDPTYSRGKALIELHRRYRRRF